MKNSIIARKEPFAAWEKKKSCWDKYLKDYTKDLELGYMHIMLICMWHLITGWENYFFFFFFLVNVCLQLENAAEPGKRMFGVLNCNK